MERRSRSARSTTATRTCIRCRSAAVAPVRLTWHPGARLGPELHAGRQSHPLHLAARHIHGTLRAALHRAGRRRDGRAASDPERRACHLFARRSADRLQPDPAALRAVEAVPRRHGVAALAVQLEGPRDREDSAARGSVERHRSDVDRRHGVLPFGPQRRVQHLLPTTRRGNRSGRSPVTTISRCSTPRPAPAGSSTNRPACCTCWIPKTGKSERLTIGVASDLRETRARFARGVRWIRSCGALADRNAGGVRLPRRDRHRSRVRRGTSAI